jgi:hypothetical protein
MPSPKPGSTNQFRQTRSTLRGCEMLTLPLPLIYAMRICSSAINSALHFLAIEFMGLLTKPGTYCDPRSAGSSTYCRCSEDSEAAYICDSIHTLYVT